MTRTTDVSSELGFELERFGWTPDDRLEVSGRWFGVRGRRFVRPVMNLRVEGRRKRLVAVLDHKPWPADGEGAWTAAFAWRGERDQITAVRLEVAPDIVLDLPAPGEDAAGAILHPRARKRAARRAEAPPPAAEPSPAPPAAEPTSAPPTAEPSPAPAAAEPSPAPPAAEPSSAPPTAEPSPAPPAAEP